MTSVIAMRAGLTPGQSKTPVSSVSTVSDEDDRGNPLVGCIPKQCGVRSVENPTTVVSENEKENKDKDTDKNEKESKEGKEAEEGGGVLRERTTGEERPAALASPSTITTPPPSTSGGKKEKSQTKTEGRKGTPWTEVEHVKFLDGLKVLGKGNWRGISKKFVPTRTPTQVASHAQKHFLRVTGATKRKSRFTALEEAFNNSYSASIYNIDSSKKRSGSFDNISDMNQSAATTTTEALNDMTATEQSNAFQQANASLVANTALHHHHQQQQSTNTNTNLSQAAAAAFAPYLGGHMPFMNNPFAATTNPQPPLEQLVAMMQANQVNQQQAAQIAQLQILMQNPLTMMQAMGIMQQQQQQQQQQLSGFPPSMFQAGNLNSNNLMTRSASAPNLMQMNTNTNNTSSGEGSLQDQQKSNPNLVLFRPVPSRPSAMAQGALAKQQQQQGVAGFNQQGNNTNTNQLVPGILGAINVQGQLGSSLKNVNSTPSLPSMIQGQGNNNSAGGASGPNPLHAAILNSIEKSNIK
jgi:SHAQKYF class myb-like DNA-binding protein